MEISEPFIDLLHCPVCFDIFRNPKCLSCGHSLCVDCVDKIKDSNTLHCPICTVENSATSLPENFSLTSLTDIYKSFVNQSCYKCGKITSAADLWICDQCDVKLYCSRCVLKSHKSCPGTPLEFREIMAEHRSKVEQWKNAAGNKLIQDMSEMFDRTTDALQRLDVKIAQLTKLVKNVSKKFSIAVDFYRRRLKKFQVRFEETDEVISHLPFDSKLPNGLPLKNVTGEIEDISVDGQVLMSDLDDLTIRIDYLNSLLETSADRLKDVIFVYLSDDCFQEIFSKVTHL
ncbi:unnamed protein product [Soboliphyme baturini]|uniref:RING-type domain-containing protein n=1 Tax=Soboliphyme baturini TaxID=241478 RepID=A0A183IHD2_9BILA|nr:unnamed protein product [Soboliphyme baturini]